MKKGLRLLMVVAALGMFAACTSKKAELGTAENPIKVHFVPSVDSKIIA